MNAHSTNSQFCTADTNGKDNTGKHHVGRFAEVNSAVNKDANTGNSDDTEKQAADTTHNRNWDAADELRKLADEGKPNSQDCGTTDDPDAVDFGYSHNTDVFTISGIWRCTEEAGENVG